MQPEPEAGAVHPRAEPGEFLPAQLRGLAPTPRHAERVGDRAEVARAVGVLDGGVPEDLDTARVQAHHRAHRHLGHTAV